MLTGPKKHTVLRVTHHEPGDAFPQEQKRVVVLLVFDADERTAQFQRGREARNQTLIVSKQRSRVEALDAASGNDPIGPADAVRSDDPAPVPREEVEVSVVEGIQIDAAAGPFTDCTVRHLTKPPDFA